MIKIRALINLRHNFMELVTGITGFIIKYTEVVKEIERSSLSSAEKVKKYNEVIAKISECETQLAVATDKGSQVRNVFVKLLLKLADFDVLFRLPRKASLRTGTRSRSSCSR